MTAPHVTNYGSAIGEAIGSTIERGVNALLKPLAEENGYIYVTYIENTKTRQPGKLLLKDHFGNAFNIDSVIVNNRMQPIVLIESKYIRYTKHNRDKGSWICNTHYNLRRSYPTVRKSIAVLAGNWSGPSLNMMRSYDVTIFEVGFRAIVATLHEYGIDITWKEKERNVAKDAWIAWNSLQANQMDVIASTLLADIQDNLRESLKTTLDDTLPHELRELELIAKTSKGESIRYIFQSIEELSHFLDERQVQEIIYTEHGPTILTSVPNALPQLSTESSEDDIEEEANDDSETE